MEYRIIATLGPASSAPEGIRALHSAGADGFRLNTSHLSVEEVELWLARLRDTFRDGQPVPPVVLDLQGGKWRLGRFAEMELVEGAGVVLFPEGALSPGPAPALPVPHPELFARVRVGDRLLLNDGRSSLWVTAAAAERVEAVVERGGPISARKGITLRGSGGGAPRGGALSDRERRIVEVGRRHGFVRFAVSYLEGAEELRRYAKHFPVPGSLIAKLERRSALQEVEEMAGLCGELWLCRGDLGAELGPKEMAQAVSRLTAEVPRLPVPVLMAGQVLEHMSDHPQPTRSEVCHLLDILKRGYAGVVLSDETAVGRYPVDSCRAAALFRHV